MLLEYRQGPSHAQATHESSQTILTSADGVGDKVLGDWKRRRILSQCIGQLPARFEDGKSITKSHKYLPQLVNSDDRGNSSKVPRTLRDIPT